MSQNRKIYDSEASNYSTRAIFPDRFTDQYLAQSNDTFVDERNEVYFPNHRQNNIGEEMIERN